MTSDIDIGEAIPLSDDVLTYGFVEATDRLNHSFLSLALLYGLATAVLGVIIAPFNRYDSDVARSELIGIAVMLLAGLAWQRRQRIDTLVSDHPSCLLVGVAVGATTLWGDTGWRSSYYLFSYAAIPVAAVLASRRWGLLCGVLLAGGYLAGLALHGYSWQELGELKDQDSVVVNAIGYPLAALFFSVAVTRMLGFVARISQIVRQQGRLEKLATASGAAPERLRTKALTPREVQVAQLVAVGLTNDEIAARLVVSPRTVHSHVGNALRKTGSSNRTELGVLAVREGLAADDGAVPRAAASEAAGSANRFC